jgi:hypothetical protein
MLAATLKDDERAAARKLKKEGCRLQWWIAPPEPSPSKLGEQCNPAGILRPPSLPG